MRRPNLTTEYHKLFAEVYDWLPRAQRRADRAFYLSYARRARGRILELGCGTGRILIPLAAAGFQVTGLDNSAAMLERCREKLAAQPKPVRERVRLVRGDMRRFQLRHRFALVTIPYRGFHHLLSVEDQLACLRCIHKHLTRNGRLLLDLFCINGEMGAVSPRAKPEELLPETKLDDGRSVRLTLGAEHTDWVRQVSEQEMIFHVHHPGGRRQTVRSRFSLRLFSRFELEHLLARCGFRIRRVFGGFDKRPPAGNSPYWLFEAAKV
ncbi:MAG TPA: class I SAM-dependent methyltransferase [Candidatus Nitrosotenuis sp.]|nr:class I SAM-dependent methyltransferase [Candidatus Nitrosotenuis sp.]